MKYAAGYIMGSLTVVAIGASFVGGIVAHAIVMEKKSEMIAKADSMTLKDIMAAYVAAKQN